MENSRELSFSYRSKVSSPVDPNANAAIKNIDLLLANTQKQIEQCNTQRNTIRAQILALKRQEKNNEIKNTQETARANRKKKVLNSGLEILPIGLEILMVSTGGDIAGTIVGELGGALGPSLSTVSGKIGQNLALKGSTLIGMTGLTAHAYYKERNDHITRQLTKNIGEINLEELKIQEKELKEISDVLREESQNFSLYKMVEENKAGSTTNTKKRLETIHTLENDTFNTMNKLLEDLGLSRKILEKLIPGSQKQAHEEAIHHLEDEILEQFQTMQMCRVERAYIESIDTDKLHTIFSDASEMSEEETKKILREAEEELEQAEKLLTEEKEKQALLEKIQQEGSEAVSKEQLAAIRIQTREKNALIEKQEAAVLQLKKKQQYIKLGVMIAAGLAATTAVTTATVLTAGIAGASVATVGLVTSASGITAGTLKYGFSKWWDLRDKTAVNKLLLANKNAELHRICEIANKISDLQTNTFNQMLAIHYSKMSAKEKILIAAHKDPTFLNDLHKENEKVLVDAEKTLELLSQYLKDFGQKDPLQREDSRSESETQKLLFSTQQSQNRSRISPHTSENSNTLEPVKHRSPSSVTKEIAATLANGITDGTLLATTTINGIAYVANSSEFIGEPLNAITMGTSNSSLTKEIQNLHQQILPELMHGIAIAQETVLTLRSQQALINNLLPKPEHVEKNTRIQGP